MPDVDRLKRLARKAVASEREQEVDLIGPTSEALAVHDLLNLEARLERRGWLRQWPLILFFVVITVASVAAPFAMVGLLVP